MIDERSPDEGPRPAASDRPPGDEPPGDAPRPADAPPPAGRPFESRAVIALRVMAIFTGIVTVLVLPAVRLDADGAAGRVAAVVGAAMTLVAYAATASAIDDHRPWAVATARRLLVLVAIVDVIGVIVGLGQSRITIPVGAILATWALLGVDRSTGASASVGGSLSAGPAGLGRSGRAVLATYLAGLTAISVVPAILVPGGPLDLAPTDLAAELTAECGPAESGPPMSIAVTYQWAWQRSSPLGAGDDGVVVAWSGVDAASQQLYTLGEVPDTDPGIHPGAGASDATGAMEQQAERGGAGGSWIWGVDVPSPGAGDRTVRVSLARVQQDPPPDLSGSETIVATYVHRGVWKKASVVTCSW